MPLILGANSVSGYTVKNSLRFNSGSSDYLNRTVSTTNRRTFTFSFWTKRSTLGLNHIYGANIDGNNEFTIRFTSSDTLQVYNYVSAYNFQLVSSALYRDMSAWYHIVVAVDTTQATSSDRVKIYVNGSQVTALGTATYPSQNFDTLVNSSSTTYNRIGTMQSSGTFYDGYMSEFNFIDGQALTPSSFGETDTLSGIWKPKAYSGTYGTNGFFLKFLNSASLGTDSSGNGNTFTVNNLTSVDQSTDTPTNNFATLNSILYSTSISYSEGNLKFTNTATAQRMVASSIAPTTGKWYAECRVTSLGGNYPQIGVLDTSIYTMDTYVGALARGYGYASHGQVYNNAGALTTGLATYTTNDIIGVALDLTNNYVYFSKNGTFINSGVPTSGSSGTGGWAITDGYDYSFGSSSLDSGTDPVFDWNFGSPFYTGGSNTDGAGYGNFSYSVPSGYYSLNTKNLANFG
jgi:hypothetical protein